MCGRYAITLPPEAIRELFRTYGEIPNWPADPGKQIQTG
jgi:hypothetical protein